MKRLISLLMCLVLALSLCVPALAFVDHESVYMALDALDNDRLAQQGTEQLPQMRDQMQFDLRVDIVSNTEDETLEDYARIFYDQYEYGYGDRKDGALLMILTEEQEDGVSLSGYTVYCGGEGPALLEQAEAQTMFETLDTLISGVLDPAEAGERCADAIDTFSGCMMNLVTLHPEVLSGAGEEAPDSEETERVLPNDELVLIPDATEAPEEAPAQAEPTAQAEAQPETQPAVAAADPYAGLLIRDEAGLLSDSERQSLEDLAQSYASKYGCGIYIHTVDSMGSETDVERYAEDYYNGCSLGYGDFRNGIMLTVAMESRDYDVAGYGRNPENSVDYGVGILAFTDYGVSQMVAQFRPYLSDGDYNRAFTTYVNTCGEYLRRYVEDGDAYDIDDIPKSKTVPLLITILVPLIIALVVCLIFMGQMKTAKPATQADNYVPQDGFQLNHQIDQYTHTTRTRRHIERNNSSGGGGTSVNSGGFSHSSGKF